MFATPLAGAVRWARRGAWVGLFAALLVPFAAYLAELGWGREVLLIAPHDPSVVTLNRSLWSPGDPVAELYGSPMSGATRVLLVGGEKVLHPEEDPNLSLLPVATAGERPIQVRTLWWAVRLAAAGLGAAAVALFGLAHVARRRASLNASLRRA